MHKYKIPHKLLNPSPHLCPFFVPVCSSPNSTSLLLFYGSPKSIKRYQLSTFLVNTDYPFGSHPSNLRFCNKDSIFLSFSQSSMAATSTTPFNSNSISNEASRQEIQAAIAKAAELRAIHAALMQGTSPTHCRPFPPPCSSSPISAVAQLSFHDYPVFTPSYEDEPLPGYCHLKHDSRVCSEGWGDHYESARKELSSLDSHFQIDQDVRSVTSSCTNHITVLQTSPAAEALKSRRRNSLGDFKSVTSCNKCMHGVNEANSITSTTTSSCKHSNIVVPLTDSHMAVHPQQQQPRSKGTVFSRLFPRLKKKTNSLARTESEEVSQILKDLGVFSVESLKKELLEANQKRDAALAEVAEIKSSFGDLRKKLENLEGYCEELKKALKLGSLSKRGKLVDGEGGDNGMPVSEEVMVEGFLQIVSEARLSVKHFCKMLVGQIEEKDDQLINNLNSLLQPYKLSLSSKYSKPVLYHLEAIINQVLYQDFENCVFQKNGPPKLLDPQQDRQAQFSSFVALRNLSWNEVIRKGTKYHSEEFSKFCDQKMSCIVATLNWIRPWPEQLLQSFFVAAKCIWLLHLLAFSFYPPLTILRVEENRPFDARYMEDLPLDRQRAQQGTGQVKMMVMPGFYVQDKILRCKVLCRSKSST